jgi:hypothetical protein
MAKVTLEEAVKCAYCFNEAYATYDGTPACSDHESLVKGTRVPIKKKKSK